MRFEKNVCCFRMLSGNIYKGQALLLPEMRFLFVASLLALLLLAGCAHTSVEDINSDTERYLGKKVVVSGEVLAPMEVGSISGFTLRQDGSSIMVSCDDVPESGSEVTVRGVVVKGLFSGHYLFAEGVTQ